MHYLKDVQSPCMECPLCLGGDSDAESDDVVRIIHSEVNSAGDGKAKPRKTKTRARGSKKVVSKPKQSKASRRGKPSKQSGDACMASDDEDPWAEK